MYNDDLTFHYREFCVALNQQSMVRQHGRYMVQLCLPREQAAAGEKYSFYYIILSISIVCLILTITIYVVFRKALLRLDCHGQLAMLNLKNMFMASRLGLTTTRSC